MLGLLRKVAIDLTPIRVSRKFRLLAAGETVSNLGTQAALVALPYQIYVSSHSATLVGLLGAFELGPMTVASLLGGVLNDRYDRRKVLVFAQAAVIGSAAALFAATLAGHPPVVVLLVLGGVLAGGSSLDSVTRAAIIPGILGPEHLRSGLAFNYGTYQLAAIVGPAVGGVLIAAVGVSTTYGIDAGSCLAMVASALAIGPQRPVEVEEHLPVRRAITEGLRFVRQNRALSGSFAIDLVAMTFGMPRALFAILSLTVYHSGARGTGFLYAAVAAGGAAAVFSSGWVVRARRLGRIVIVAVLVWGLAILAAGLVRSLWPAVALLAFAGAADGFSAVCRSTISQASTPDEMRGRMSAVHNLVVTSGVRLGDVESGLVAGATTALTSVIFGGAVCVLGVGVVILAFPQLVAYDVELALS